MLNESLELSQIFALRKMTRAEVEIAEEWAAKEGWNPGNFDADCFYSTDPDGFFIAERKGLPAGCIFAVKYGESFGFLGCYLVRPEFRGKGLGTLIWNAALESMGNRNIGLDAVLSQEENYRRSGFKRAYLNLRFQGTGTDYGSMPREVVSLSKVPFEDIARYDSELFPAPRPRFLQSWINQPQGASFGFLREGRLSGYGVIRGCRVGFRIGPLFADDEGAAEGLFQALAIYAGNHSIFMDVPEVNPAAIILAKHHGMEKFAQAVRMYNKEKPALPMNRIFGVTSLQLG